MKKIVCRPTVKNVLIPGVISPMPPPPRRNRRRHRIRVACSECHCPTSAKNNNNNSSSSIILNSTKSRSKQTVKHNPTHHPLVRSKSAVVRSLYRKMRTPFTRSQTVDENLLRYYSPETSEYTVSEGYILKPEKLVGKRKNDRIPEIYIEDCLQVNFADRLLDKFRNSTTSRSNYATLPIYNVYETMRKNSNSSKRPAPPPPTTASLSRRLPSGWKEPLENSIVSRSRPFGTSTGSSLAYPTDYELKNLITRSSTIPRRSLLSSKARSFDYSVANDDDPVFSSESLGGDAAASFLSRRAKSFEYETVSSNIFSDDSLRTARSKFKRNLSISDPKYGDEIAALRDRSKSYYDSNGHNELRKTLAANSLLGYDHFEPHPEDATFYGYDPHLVPASRMEYFDSIDSRLPASSIVAREDIGKRKYIDSSYRSPEKRTKSLENDFYGNRATNDHVYCSIDEIILPEDSCPCRLEASERSSTSVDLIERNDFLSRRHAKPRRRAKSTDSYLDEDEYENWELGYDSEFPQLEDSKIPILDVEGYYEEKKSPKKPRSSRIETESLRDRIIDGYDSYNESGQFYADESLSYRDDEDEIIGGGSSYEEASQRRRRGRRFRDNFVADPSQNLDLDYENFAINRKNTLTVPSFSQSKKMMIGRAESTPILPPHDEEYALAEQRMIRRMSRRRRNSSCPESRELVANETGSNELEAGRADEEQCGFFIDSDEEFGSMETVIGPNYGDSTSRKDSRLRYDDLGETIRQDPVDNYRAIRSERSESFSGTTRSHRDDDDVSSGYQYRRRKSSCPECREMQNFNLDPEVSRRDQRDPEDSYKYRKRRRRRNSSCPEARDIELYEEERRRANNINQPQQQRQQQQQQQGSKRNVAISDTLEYYEYSMESESQCSENCGFGPYDSLRPRNRAAPRPGNANSNIFDSQKTATSDTAKNPRATDDDDDHPHHHHHHHQNQRDYPKRRNDLYDQYNDNDLDRNHNDDNLSSKTMKNMDYPDNKRDDDQSTTRPSSQRTNINDNDRQTDTRQNNKQSNDLNERRSSSMPESSEYASQGSSYEKTSRHPPPGNGHNGHTKRGQFTRSLSNADVPPDEKVGEFRIFFSPTLFSSYFPYLFCNFFTNRYEATIFFCPNQLILHLSLTYSTYWCKFAL